MRNGNLIGLAFAACLAGLFAGAGTAAAKESAENARLIYTQAFSQGRPLSELEPLARKWVQAAPGDWTSYAGLCGVQRRRRNFKEAIANCEKALSLNPSAFPPVVSLAYIYGALWDEEKMAEYEGKLNGLAATVDPATCYFSIGFMHWLALHDEKAIEYYLKSLDYQKDRSETYANLLHLYTNTSNPSFRNGDTAMRYVKLALEDKDAVDPGVAEAHVAALYDQGNTKEALRQARKYITALNAAGPGKADDLEAFQKRMQAGECVFDGQLDALEVEKRGKDTAYVRNKNGRPLIEVVQSANGRSMAYQGGGQSLDGLYRAVPTGKAIFLAANGALASSGVQDANRNMRKQPVVIAEVMEASLGACTVKPQASLPVAFQFLVADSRLVGKRDKLKATYSISILHNGASVFDSKPQTIELYNADITKYAVKIPGGKKPGTYFLRVRLEYGGERSEYDVMFRIAS